ncbi:MAG: glycosyltransferase family 39 protein [Candidatus Omnitrophica bacterium]|nr:glycosyltransferase family 39 protein [Candidatus Omnitrophota bacterium]
MGINAVLIKKKWTIGLIALFVVIVALNTYILHNDNLYPRYDSSLFVASSINMAQQVKNGHVPVPHGKHLNPPLYEYVMMLIVLFFGSHVDILVCTNYIFTIFLFVGLYRVVRYILSKRMGFLAVCICLSMPVVIGHSRLLWHEYALMCMNIFSIYLLFKSKYLTRFKYVFLTGCFVGGIMLLKVSAVIYIAIPMLLYCIKAFHISKNKGMIVRRAIIFMLLVFTIAAWWYIANYEYVLSRYKVFLTLEEDYVTPLQCLRWAYAKLCNQCLLLPLFIIFLASFPFLFIPFKFEKAILGSCIVVPIIVHAFSSYKLGFDSVRYFLPLMPFIAFSIVNFVFFVWDNKHGRFLYMALIILCSLQISLVHRGHVSALQFQDSVLDHQCDFDAVVEKGKLTPQRHFIRPRLFLEAMKKATTGQPITIILALNHPQLESYFIIEKSKDPNKIILTSAALLASINRSTDMKTDDPTSLDRHEFIIVLGNKVKETDDVAPSFATEWIPNIMSEFEKRKKNYRELMREIDNSGYEIILYQKIRDGKPAMSTG